MSEDRGIVEHAGREPADDQGGLMARGDNEERLAANDRSRNKADHHAQPWSEYEDQLLQELWTETHTEEELAEIAETLGRTIEACRQRYYVVRRAESVTYETRTTTESEGRRQTDSRRVERRRPAWMDEEGLPDWYV